MRICIDLDGVISSLRIESDDYSELEPLEGAVKKINHLKKNGHYIIIYTARNMKTQKGNIGKVISNIGQTTLNWLKKHNIQYDEIYFGKPWADIYIDDNAHRFINWSSIDNNGANLPVSNEIKLKSKKK